MLQSNKRGGGHTIAEGGGRVPEPFLAGGLIEFPRCVAAICSLDVRLTMCLKKLGSP